MYQSEILGLEVSLEFIDGNTGLISWYRGTIKGWKLKKKKHYFTTLHYIEFDDGETWWINLNFEVLQDNVRWHTNQVNIAAAGDDDNDVIVMEVISDDEEEM